MYQIEEIEKYKMSMILCKESYDVFIAGKFYYLLNVLDDTPKEKGSYRSVILSHEGGVDSGVVFVSKTTFYRMFELVTKAEIRQRKIESILN